MKRIRAIILLICLSLAILSILTISGVQYVTTNEDVYESGEIMNISYWDIGLLDCSLQTKVIDFYMKVNNTWKEIQNNEPIYVERCVNGSVGIEFRGNEGISRCKISPHVESGSRTWDQKIFKDMGYRRNCSGKILEDSIKNYSIQKAPKGTYKVQYGHFGLTEKIFEIK